MEEHYNFFDEWRSKIDASRQVDNVIKKKHEEGIVLFNGSVCNSNPASSTLQVRRVSLTMTACAMLRKDLGINIEPDPRYRNDSLMFGGI